MPAAKLLFREGGFRFPLSIFRPQSLLKSYILESPSSLNLRRPSGTHRRRRRPIIERTCLPIYIYIYLHHPIPPRNVYNYSTPPNYGVDGVDCGEGGGGNAQNKQCVRCACLFTR